MTPGLPIGIASLGALSIFLIAISTIPAKNVLKSRIEKLERISAKSLTQRHIIIDQIVSKEHTSNVRQRLNEAGWYDLSPHALTLRSIGALGIGICIGALLIVFLQNDTLGVVVGILVALLGWRLPSIVLSRCIKTRKDSIAQEVPDFLDLLSTTVQAGLSLNASMIQAVDATTGPLNEELTSTLSEIRLGRSRSDALQAMANRVNESSITTMALAIVQAEKLGSNLTDVLRELATDSRDRRWTRAEERASQLPIKMIIPMGLFMIPSLYLMIFGPVIAHLVQHK
jgi:tight adherence protein C